jgi:AcrR family transcriptional regulator
MTTVTPETHRPMRADAVRNRHRILESAAAALAESGPDVALEEIAARAGVGIGTLYRHFPDRSALLVAVYREGFDALASLGEELATSDDPSSALRQFLEAQLDFSRTHRGLAADVIRSALDELVADRSDDPAVESPCQLLCDRGAELLDRAQRSGTVRRDVDIEQVMRLVAGIAMATDECTGTRQQSGHHLLGLVFDGLQAGRD